MFRFATFLLAAALTSPVMAMTFTLISDPCGGGNGSTCGPRIFGQGNVERGDAQKLRAAVTGWKRSGVSGFSGITLSSPGGSLLGGMLLGEEIRQLRLDTYAETEMTAYQGSTGPSRQVDAKVQCHSACVYAFLGGQRRIVYDGAVFGVHQFATTGSPAPNLEGAAQVTVVALREYVQHMGVSGKLVDLASTVPARTIHVLTPAEIVSFRVDNSKAAPAEWGLKAASDGTPFLRNRIELPDGRVAIVSLGKLDNDIGVHLALYLPRPVVAPERIQMFPVGSRPEFKLRVGRQTIPVAPERPWAKVKEDPNGVMFDAGGRLPGRYAPVLAAATALTLVDEGCPLAGQDVCMMSADLGVEGLGNGLKLLARSR